MYLHTLSLHHSLPICTQSLCRVDDSAKRPRPLTPLSQSHAHQRPLSSPVQSINPQPNEHTHTHTHAHHPFSHSATVHLEIVELHRSGDGFVRSHSAHIVGVVSLARVLGSDSVLHHLTTPTPPRNSLSLRSHSQFRHTNPPLLRLDRKSTLLNSSH